MSILDIHSFSYAFQGIKTAFQDQLNFRFHVVIASIVIVVTLFLALSPLEWIFIFSAIFCVFITELFNSALEYLADALTQEFHPLIKKAKDVSAAAVLLSALYSVLIAFFIIFPKIFRMIFA